MTTFAAAFQTQLENILTTLTWRQRKLLEILREPDCEQRRRRVQRMERRCRTEFGLGDEQIDWSTIPWKEILQTVLSILVAILPLLLAL